MYGYINCVFYQLRSHKSPPYKLRVRLSLTFQSGSSGSSDTADIAFTSRGEESSSTIHTLYIDLCGVRRYILRCLWYNCGTKCKWYHILFYAHILLSAWVAWCLVFVSGMGRWHTGFLSGCVTQDPRVGPSEAWAIYPTHPVHLGVCTCM